MSREPRLSGALPLAVVLSLTGACLPRGDAPAGRQILADKTAVLTGVVPTQDDGVVRVIFFRPGKDADNVNLWVVAVDPDGGPSAEKMLFADIDTGLELGYRPTASNAGFPMDSQGRVYLSQFVASTAPGQSYMIKELRADPVTGEVVDLGQRPNVATPPGAWEYPTVNNFTGAPVVFEANGGVTVADVASYGFGGTTAFYLTTDGTLVSLDAAGVARQLATGLATFLTVNAQTVLITRAVTDSNMIQPTPAPDPSGLPPGPPPRVTGALLDTTTLVETPLPDGLLYQYARQPSPSGRWLIVSQSSQDPTQQYGSGQVLLDTVTGTTEPLEAAFSYAIWRPGRDELWAASVDDPEQTGLLSTTSLAIKKPGLPTLIVPGVDFKRFSDDGAYWFSQGAPLTAQDSSDLVGLADDPTGPRFAAVPAGSSLGNAWVLGDGRLLDDATVGLDAFEDSYVQIVDPRNGAARVVGEHGFLATVGATRALGIYHVSYLRGDLTTTDFATGRSTVLAAEFAESAVAEPRGADPYPPGGRIVYQFVAHFDSPWNGLWMATVP